MTIQFKLNGGRGIEWCDDTKNPIGGCLHDCQWKMPDGKTAVCYAGDIANSGVAKAGYPNGFAHHYWRPSVLREITRDNKPGFTFGNSMSDWMGSWVPQHQVEEVLDAISTVPNRVYQMLTKAPPRLLKFTDLMPNNLWPGVSSAPDQMMKKTLTRQQQTKYMERALDVLGQLNDRGLITWMSIEPLSWDISPLLKNGHPLRWVVIGAATDGPKKFQPDPNNVQKLLDIFDATNTPVFFKGNLKWEPRREDFPVIGADGQPIPAVLHRQEMAAKYGWPLNQHLLLWQQKGIEQTLNRMFAPTAVTGQMSWL